MNLVVLSMWVLMMLFLPNWLIFQAARRERVRTGRIAREIWRLGKRRY